MKVIFEWHVSDENFIILKIFVNGVKVADEFGDYSHGGQMIIAALATSYRRTVEAIDGKLQEVYK